MKTSDFDYNLPKELIAQHPKQKRDQSRLLVYSGQNERTSHDYFYNLPKYLKRGDVLVVNNSKVFPARLIGRKKDSGGAAEILLNQQKEAFVWEALGKNCKEGNEIVFPGSILTAKIVDKNDKVVLVKFNKDAQDFFESIEKIGHIPLPPYIKREKDESEDRNRYQTVYSKQAGSVAAPTAGLHFTKELIDEIKSLGVDVVEITLHVGLGTFAPVEDSNIKSGKLHNEYFFVPKNSLEIIFSAKKEGKRVISVGTTTTRVLEYLSKEILSGKISDISGSTNIFIFPGYKFRIIDGLITNFHLPKSSLIMLVSALLGRDKIISIYKGAIEKEYRFFSYGDAMLILP